MLVSWASTLIFLGRNLSCWNSHVSQPNFSSARWIIQVTFSLPVSSISASVSIDDDNQPFDLANIAGEPHPRQRAFVPQRDSIKTQYHPRSDRPVKVKEDLFENYCEHDKQPELESTFNKRPWLPFESKSDFEFAEVAQDAHLNNIHIDRLLSIFQRCLAGEDKLHIRTSKQLNQSWSQASKLLPAVSLQKLCIFNYTNTSLVSVP